MNDSMDNDWKKCNSVNTIRLAKWTAAWVITLAITTFGPFFLWPENDIITVAAIGGNFLVGIGMIWANKQHLASLDELQQKIQLNAMALSLGVGLIVGISYSTLSTTGIINAHAEISHLIIVMSLTYSVGILLGNRKYR
ncbi:hypothetical protein [Shewanella sp. TC10]|uniref:hypothetical protein n=1 Tax=Shewanella sp. TC10 TaxID=1419739 RepID=UPI00129DB733|nr:hypothetical protein [Shewanella sp. TC10]